MKGFIRLAAVLLAAAVVFGIAVDQDSHAGRDVPQTTEPAEMQGTEPQAPETVVTVPEETEPAETEAVPERFLLTFVGDCTLASAPGQYNRRGGLWLALPECAGIL